MIGNKTMQQAIERVAYARVGSVGDEPTLEYMRALREEIAAWLESIECEIFDIESDREEGNS